MPASGPRSPPPALGGSNLLLEGDNLLWLRALAHDPTIAGKVALVYIDPPFSTGHSFPASRTADEIAFDDRLTGGPFLTFLRERLEGLRQLLSDRGSIYLHIDNKVGHKVRLLLDEVFGEERFINEIARIKCNPKNFSRAAFGNVKDVLFFYSKTPHRVWNESREPVPVEDIARLFPKTDAQGRRYTTNPLHAPGVTQDGPTGRPWKGIPPPVGRHWRYAPAVLTRLDEQGRIEWSERGNPRVRIYADEKVPRGKKRQDIWEFKDPPYPSYPTEKSLDLLRTIVAASSSPGDLVLDAFCGSGTTLVAAQELDRRWVGIDASSQAIRVARKRLEEVGSVFELRRSPPGAR
ncbi:MAG: site-specific DNA-methyltransferase [Euryarchaeota archaeon]|nr:site-specific DNA-methyltransferase [Euryarchaeota archaeon]MDE1836442.1 site-specific DNA-methyltransferase [Euryarchaeota archaeon]MDE1879043.1 site-specific DNA-methyltransferase [Euryarchaeota archaeon]MDE2044190.1 site-specific DNA-methyltransferase [Thermoplasmata archaeon]